MKNGENAEAVSYKERQLWAHAAAHIGMVLANLTKGFDEVKFNEDLEKLESVVNEIKKLEDRQASKRDRKAEQSGRSGGSVEQP